MSERRLERCRRAYDGVTVFDGDVVTHVLDGANQWRVLQAHFVRMAEQAAERIKLEKPACP